MPRYVEATHESFFCSGTSPTIGGLYIRVVRHFKLPKSE
jgi:hypothetical protein